MRLLGPFNRAALAPARFLLLLGAAFAGAGPQCATGSNALDGQSPVAPSGLDAAALLADSAIRHEWSGGIAGFVATASFVARDGTVFVEYRPPFGRAPSEVRRASFPAESYLALWKEIERVGVRSVPSSGEPEPRGADRIRQVLEARVGTSATELIWMDDEPPSHPPGLRTLTETIDETARKAVGEP